MYMFQDSHLSAVVTTAGPSCTNPGQMTSHLYIVAKHTGPMGDHCRLAPLRAPLYH